MERNGKFYDTYFTVKDTLKRGSRVAVNSKAVDDFINGASCYWVLLSNTEKDTRTAMSHYRIRNDIELQFDDFKNTIDCNRLRTHNESTMKVKVFICFLSLIVLNELKKEVAAISPQDRKYWTWKKSLSKVSTYGKCKFTNKYRDVYTLPTKAQRMFFKALQIDYVWKGEKVAFDADIEEDETTVSSRGLI